MENKNTKNSEAKSPKNLEKKKKDHALKHRPLNHLRKSLEAEKCLSRL
tara:strand:+ start:1739 stop:1882 length:144 start_codon:yes stop_codon:yes gene_type:complete